MAQAPIVLVPVKSDKIAAVGYDADAEVARVAFKPKGLYEYSDVSAEEYAALLAAESKGKHFNEFWRGKPFVKISSDTAVDILAMQSSGLTPAPLFGGPLPQEPPAADTLVDEITIPGVKVETSTALDIADRAAAMQVVDIDSHKRAQQLVIDIARVRKQITETFEPMKKAAHAAHKSVCDTENRLTAPLDQARSIVVQRIGSFEREEEAQRRERQRQAQLKAEEEDRARRQREAEEQAKAEAEEARLRGNEEEAQAIEAAPVAPPPPLQPVHVAIEAPTISHEEGFGMRPNWKAEIINPALIPAEFLMPNVPLINSTVKNSKGMRKIPGVRIYNEPTAAVRGK